MRRRRAPATERNRDPILRVLRQALPGEASVLEVAAGTGEHATYFARHMPGWVWQPTEAGPLESIAAWREWAGVPNLRPPVHLNVSRPPWALTQIDAVFCANLLHISPWQACRGLFSGAARVLPAHAPLVIYGPFLRDDTPTAPSNAAFDRDLRARDAAWGIRRLADVEDVAGECRFVLEGLTEMPANNLTVVFRKLPPVS